MNLIPQYRKTHVCAGCGKEFVATMHTSTACSVDCRFTSYVKKTDGCWEWTGPKNTQNYGRLFLDTSKDGKRLSIAAHRYALNRIGIETPGGKLVMHSCDNPSCVNPDHLSVGTWGENNGDRSRKGRSGSRVFSEAELAHYRETFKGTGNPAAKLTEENVRAIRKDARSSQVIADEYGVSKKAVLNIRHRRSWSYVSD